MSLGYLPGAHDPDAPPYARIATLGPAWLSAGPDSRHNRRDDA